MCNMSKVASESIKGDLDKTGTKACDVYKAMGISPAQWYRKKKDPGLFTIDELNILRRYISDETVRILIPKIEL